MIENRTIFVLTQTHSHSYYLPHSLTHSFVWHCLKNKHKKRFRVNLRFYCFPNFSLHYFYVRHWIETTKCKTPSLAHSFTHSSEVLNSDNSIIIITKWVKNFEDKWKMFAQRFSLNRMRCPMSKYALKDMFKYKGGNR